MAAATVAVLTPSSAAVRRTEATRVPGTTRPAVMSASTLAAISPAPEPRG
jgi:hypothetical protein